MWLLLVLSPACKHTNEISYFTQSKISFMSNVIALHAMGQGGDSNILIFHFLIFLSRRQTSSGYIPYRKMWKAKISSVRTYFWIIYLRFLFLFILYIRKNAEIWCGKVYKVYLYHANRIFFKNRGPWLGKTPWGLLSNRKADLVLAPPPPPKNSLKIVQMFC